MAKTQGTKYLLVTREIIDMHTEPGYKEHDLDYMGVRLIEEGKEDLVAKKHNTTTEEFNFG